MINLDEKQGGNYWQNFLLEMDAFFYLLSTLNPVSNQWKTIIFHARDTVIEARSRSIFFFLHQLTVHLDQQVEDILMIELHRDM